MNDTGGAAGKPGESIMKHVGTALTGALVLAASATASAAQPQKPPIAVYWLSADTSSGLPTGGGAMSIAAMMMGGGTGGAQRSLLLQLGSQRQADGTATASHQIPAGMKMGNALPLVTPVNPTVREPRDDGVPENFERPKGRMLIYWGCGEQTRPGQPVIIDFAKMASGQSWPAGLFSLHLTPQRPPASGRNRTYGDWPNKDDATRVPADASLLGDHAIKGNYSPDIAFAVDDKHDFLAPVALDTSAKTAGGGVTARWQAIPHALGYFATFMGSAGGDDVVIWSSSETKVFGETLMTWLPNADVARLVKDKIVMPPQATECVVPAAVAKSGQGGVMRFIAYGDELNVAFPPPPKDPKATWEPQWAVKLRQKSTTTALLGVDAPMANPSGSRNNQPEAAGEPPANAAVKEGVKALRGLFGF